MSHALFGKDVLLLPHFQDSFDEPCWALAEHDFVDLVPDRSQLGQPRVFAQDLTQRNHLAEGSRNRLITHHACARFHGESITTWSRSAAKAVTACLSKTGMGDGLAT